MNNGLESMWKEAFLKSLKVISKTFPGGSEENQERLLQEEPIFGT